MKTKKQKGKDYPIKRVAEKDIRTTESWYPTVDGKVRVRLTGLTTGEWRVSVWGGDDDGMERDFPRVERQEARSLYDRLVDNTTKAEMTGLGMVRA